MTTIRDPFSPASSLLYKRSRGPIAVHHPVEAANRCSMPWGQRRLKREPKETRRLLLGSELEDDGLAGELVVDGGEGVELVFHRGGVLWVEEAVREGRCTGRGTSVLKGRRCRL